MEETLTTKGASDDLDDATSGPISPKGHPAIRIEISRRVRTMALCDCPADDGHSSPSLSSLRSSLDPSPAPPRVVLEPPF
jgi:hypothetical protein